MNKLQLDGPFSGVLLTKQTMLLVLVGGIILCQALAVIYSKQTRRLLHAQLQALYATRDKLQVEWSKLLLEQGTWQTETRVEKIAREQLGMVIPDKTNVIAP